MDAGERAATEADSADGADGVVVGERDVGALRFFVDGHFRDDRDAHACGNHAEQAGELATFENNLGMEARAIAGGEGVFAEAVTIAEKEEGFRTEVFERDGALARERMRVGQSGEKGLRKNGKRFEFVATDG